MVEIPNTYARRPIPEMRQPSARITNAGAPARALRSVAQGLDNVAAGIDEFAEKRAAAEALDADTALQAQINDALYDPESGYLTLKQRGAVDAHEAFISKLDGMKDGALQGLSARGRKRAERVIASRIESARAVAMRHAASENDRWVSAATESAIAINKDAAVLAWNDPRAVNKAIAANNALIDGRAVRLGLSPEEVALQKLEGERDVIAGVVMARAAEDPIGALEFARANKERLGGAAYNKIEATLTPIARAREGQDIARSAYRGTGGASAPLAAALAKYEARGDYDALYKFSNREGGRFAGVKVTNMTVDEAIRFSAPGGEYAQWVKGEIGRVATPMGSLQIVGSTLRKVKDEMGLTGSEKMSPELQSAMALHLAKQRLRPGMSQAEKRASLRAEWAGLKHASNGEVDAIIADVEAGGAAASGPLGLEAVLKNTENAHPDVRDAAIDEYIKLERVSAARLKLEKQALEQRAFGIVLADGDIMKELSPQELEMLGPEYVKKLRNWDGDRETNEETFYRLTLMSSENPKEFANINLMDHIEDLSTSDFKDMAEAQAKIRAGKTDVNAKYSGIRAMTERALGKGFIDFNAEYDTTEGKRTAAFYAGMKTQIDRYVAENGKMPSEAEVGEMAKRMAAEMPVASEPGFWDLSGKGMANTFLPEGLQHEGEKVTYLDAMTGIMTAIEEGDSYTLGRITFDAEYVDTFAARMNVSREEAVMLLLQAMGEMQ